MTFESVADHRMVSAAITTLARTSGTREKTVTDTVQVGLRHFAAGAAVEGLATLNYAQRLAPSDHGIMFAVGLFRLLLGDRRATEPLELLATQTGHRSAVIHLTIARLRFSNPEQAAVELHKVLRDNSPEQSDTFRVLANNIAQATGRLGWCGLDNSGRVTIGGLAAQASSSDLEIIVDGRRLDRLGHTGTLEKPRRIRLPIGWEKARWVNVSLRGTPLIGSPVDIGQVTRIEGLVAAPDAGGIVGWCWYPGEPETAPMIILRSLENAPGRSPGSWLRIRASDILQDRKGFSELSEPRQFAMSAAECGAFSGAVEVRGPHDRTLFGSPVWPLAALESARAAASAIAALYPASGPPNVAQAIGREPCIPVSMAALRLPPIVPEAARGIDVIIPVYRGLKVTMACLDSVLAARAMDERVVVVVDASPDAELVAQLQALATKGVIELSLQVVNRGFPATANIGLRMAAGRDAVLLNSDTLVPPGWLALLHDAVHGAHDIGTATPMSNDATIFSYPLVNAANTPPDLAEVMRTATLAQLANAGIVVDVPTGNGFCMYIRAECLMETGALREDVFAQGYGEENDFCMRARVFGWRHVAVPGAYVGHIGSQSFAAHKRHLIERNLATLNRLHVGYDRLIAAWLRADPLAASRRNMDRLKLSQASHPSGSVLLISHGRSGGVLRHVRERTLIHEQAGQRALLLRPGRSPDGTLFCVLEHEAGDPTPNLRFHLPADIGSLHHLLLENDVRVIELHHFIGYQESLLQLVMRLGCPYDVYVHDYAWLCPRVTLTNGTNRYCGEPPVAVCTRCVADNGNNIDDDITPTDLRARSAALLNNARRVIVPSLDTAQRIKRHFGVDVLVSAWESNMPPPPAGPILLQGRHRRVCIVGAIGLEKGYETLLGVARIAAERDLPLEFALVGYSCDDSRLLETGHVSITGRYEEANAVRLIQDQNADFAFLPALWPETWSYVLSQIWKAGLPVLAYDFGAPAERIRANGGGIVLPLHMPLERLASLLIEPALFQLPVEAQSSSVAGAMVGFQSVTRRSIPPSNVADKIR